eukprot:TRINITY_DN8700_c0_g1_i1.p3 TRINITY_DN8700_c0_g1~~TRINITY_DN8700_c0_g1_i1.p3  ORF type:complete len:110 (+),score=25.92 TRINITY_DN8700_c0_g1_i1:328-657(+)
MSLQELETFMKKCHKFIRGDIAASRDALEPNFVEGLTSRIRWLQGDFKGHLRAFILGEGRIGKTSFMLEFLADAETIRFISSEHFLVVLIDIRVMLGYRERKPGEIAKD